MFILPKKIMFYYPIQVKKLHCNYYIASFTLYLLNVKLFKIRRMTEKILKYSTTSRLFHNIQGYPGRFQKNDL